jgi:NAD(P)H-dependent flavin oxidoreductase YrpB (nitropropane dioxygenase family)
LETQVDYVIMPLTTRRKTMAINTRFTELLGCMVPIQCAGMGTASPRLAVEVAKAGGLGMLSGVMLSAEQLEACFIDMPTNTSGCIGVNFLIPFLEDESVIDVAAKHSRTQNWCKESMTVVLWLAGRLAPLRKR